MLLANWQDRSCSVWWYVCSVFGLALGSVVAWFCSRYRCYGSCSCSGSGSGNGSGSGSGGFPTPIGL